MCRPGMRAENIVAAHLADECEVQLTYSIGSSQPVSVQVDTFDTAKLSDKEIARAHQEALRFQACGHCQGFRTEGTAQAK